MTIETVLDIKDICKLWLETADIIPHCDHHMYFAGAIEQAVLQSPEIQALRKDAAMLDWLDSTNVPFKMGWNVGLAPAGNASVSSVIQLGGSVTPIRAAIDAAMEKQP